MPTGINEPKPPCTRVPSLTHSAGVSARMAAELQNRIRITNPNCRRFGMTVFRYAELSITSYLTLRDLSWDEPLALPLSLAVQPMPIFQPQPRFRASSLAWRLRVAVQLPQCRRTII